MYNCKQKNIYEETKNIYNKYISVEMLMYKFIICYSASFSKDLGVNH